VPELPCLDIARAVEFYAERLGFAPSFRFSDHAGLTRDAVEIHLRLCSDPAIPKNSGCRIEVNDARALHEELKRQGVLEADAANPPENLHEFTVLDSDGNRITFAQDLAATEGESR
jgi:catechol 2,3-dioxygenase-like lactoylglutathione lyase family enzyme